MLKEQVQQLRDQNSLLKAAKGKNILNYYSTYQLGTA